MVRYWVIAVASSAFFLTGCGQDTPLSPDKTGDARHKATEATAEQTESQASLPKPPNGALAVESQRETGELGGYCWDGVCTEATFEVPPRVEALTVPSGSDLLFEYGGNSTPTKVQAKAYALVRGKVERDGEALQVSQAGAQAWIPAEVSPGEYVVEMFVRVPEGSAFYYFRTAVGMVTLPTSGGPGRQGPEDR